MIKGEATYITCVGAAALKSVHFSQPATTEKDTIQQVKL